MAEGSALSVLLNNAVEMIYFSAHGPSNDASDTEKIGTFTLKRNIIMHTFQW